MLLEDIEKYITETKGFTKIDEHTFKKSVEDRVVQILLYQYGICIGTPPTKERKTQHDSFTKLLGKDFNQIQVWIDDTLKRY